MTALVAPLAGVTGPALLANPSTEAGCKEPCQNQSVEAKEKQETVMRSFVADIAFALALAAGTSVYAAPAMDANNNKGTLKQLMQRTKALEAVAESAAEHRELPEDCHQLARLQRQESAKMDERAMWYARLPISSSEKFRRSTIDASLFFAREYRDAAQKSEDLAARHERLTS